jgi:hypothetical protein
MIRRVFEVYEIIGRRTRSDTMEWQHGHAESQNEGISIPGRMVKIAEMWQERSWVLSNFHTI